MTAKKSISIEGPGAWSKADQEAFRAKVESGRLPDGVGEMLDGMLGADDHKFPAYSADVELGVGDDHDPDWQKRGDADRGW